MAPTPRLLVLPVAFPLLLVGCADDAGDATTDLAVTGTGDLTFEPDEVTVPVSEEVTVELSAEAVEHDLVIADAAEVGHAGEAGHGDHDGGDEDGDGGEDGGHAEQGDLHVAHADADETVTATFAIDEAGTYEIYCSVPGHRDAGMTATLAVVDA